MKRTPLTRSTPGTRKPRKRRAPGTACQEPGCRRLRADEVDGRAYCLIHTADHLCKRIVKARDGHCVRCGSEGPLDWAHVVSRSYRSVRWSIGLDAVDPWNNSVSFCRPCHYWQTNHPLEGEEFFRSLGLDLDNLRYLALHDPKPDMEALIETLRGAARARP